MKRLKHILFAAVYVFAIAAPVATLATPTTAYAAEATSCDGRFLGIPPWYRGLTDPGNDCAIKSPGTADGALEKFIWTIVLNVIEMVIVIVGYIAIFFIIYGGFLYMTGGANPSMIENGRKTILNAVIGLVIAMGSIALTNLLFSLIG